METKKNSKSIFRTILGPLLFVLVLEMLLLIGSLTISGVNHKLNQSAIDIMAKQVENRSDYLESVMLGSWSNLSILAEKINTETQRMIDSGEISLEDLDSIGVESAPLITNIVDELIDDLYNKQVTGIFVVFNTKDLDGERDNKPKTGVYIRDLDPLSAPSYRRSDLLLVRAPIDVVRNIDISTSSNWEPLFPSNEWQNSGFLYKPFQTAYNDANKLTATEYGYWNQHVYRLNGDDRNAISYSIPLILEDGTVYGVLGIELLEDYIELLLPYEELNDEIQGSYVLAVSEKFDDSISKIDTKVVLKSGGPSLADLNIDKDITLNKDYRGGYTLGDDYYSVVNELNLYSNNGPYSNSTWKLLGIVPTSNLFSAWSEVKGILSIAIFITFVMGVLSSFLVSKRLSKPVIELSSEIKAKKDSKMPEFSDTGIREIDQFSKAITELSKDVINTSTKFLKIMDMASVELGGYEIWDNSENVYVTDNFLELIGVDYISAETLTKKRLLELVKGLEENYYGKSGNGNRIYQIEVDGEKTRYIRMETARENNRQVGLVEDVTVNIMEKIRIEHERDHDLLTDLYSRRAFYREVEKLFSKPEKLKCGAFLMMDLDNLKKVNDTFGHNLGDQYIYQAARCFINNTPPNTLRARVSGDEFYLFFYGYDSKDEIRKIISNLSKEIKKTVLVLPSGKEMNLSLSGGVGWYPDDSKNLNTLIKYADFAMYRMKQSNKGSMGEFDLGVYNDEMFRIYSRKELHELIENELLFYHFQPIVDAYTGGVYAYEALMRVNMNTLKTPPSVIVMAKEEGRLHDIERITMFKATETFKNLTESGDLDKDAYLFVNSLASQYMTDEESNLYSEKFKSVIDKVVIEITEEEHLDDNALERKRNIKGFKGTFALDDYGTGYNSEVNLLKINPKYIKVDVSIIRDIDTNEDKQQIFENMVSYAHHRDMLVLAEGVETENELKKVLELGADLLQGYFLARPSAVPDTINEVAVDIIKNHKI